MTLFSLPEWELSLERGTGRAALLIQAFWQTHAEAMRPALVHAIENDLRYDRQCEYNRALYLHDLISLTGETAFFRAKTRHALYHANEDTFWQLMELSRRFAQDGDMESRTALYAAFEKEAAQSGEHSGSDDIVLLDGAQGLLWLAEHYSEEAFGENGIGAEDFDWIISEWETQNGEAEVWRELEAACVQNPASQRWFQAWKTYRDDEKQRRAEQQRVDNQRPRRTYAELRAMLDEEGRIGYWGTSWGRRATPEELKRAAQDLLAETEPKRITQMLKIFTKTPFPLHPAPLLEWAKSDDEQLFWFAQMALAEIRHPAVREFAMELLRGGQERDLPHAVSMLIPNYVLGDEILVLQALAHLMPTPFYRHGLCLEAKLFDETHPSSQSIELLSIIYRETNCGVCRGGAVSRLEELNAVPLWMQAELPFDAYHHTRPHVSDASKTNPQSQNKSVV